MKKIIRYWWILFIIFILLYLIVGAAAPFYTYKAVSESTEQNFDADHYFREEESVDRAMLMETNQSAWDERIRLIQNAKDRIIMSTFDMREGESTRDVLSVIQKKADEGVQVRILVDGFAGVIRMHSNPLFAAVSAHPNIQVKLYNPLNPLLPWKTQGRMHDKYVIADDKAVILGGRNLFDYFVGSYETKHRSSDREVLIYNTAWDMAENDSSVLYEILTYFEKVWALPDSRLFKEDESLLGKAAVSGQADMLRERYESILKARPDLFSEPDYEKLTVETKGVHLLSNPITIYGKEPVVLYQLTELMKHAKERVIIHTPYLVCNDYMYERLAQIVEQAPDVKLVMNSVENGDNFMASSDYLYNKKKVVKTGIPVCEYDGGISYHGKSAVIDGHISIIGSFNFDLRSAYCDTEMMLVINSRELTAQLEENMEIIHRDCRRVIDEKNYEVPDGLEVEKVPFVKRMLMLAVGFVMQGFRYLV